MSHERDTQRLVEEIDCEQSPVTWPETLNAGRAVDEFLWRGDPKATPIQRIGLAIFSLGFLFIFAVSIVLMIVRRDVTTLAVGMFLGTLSGIAGFRLLFNVFRRKARRQIR